MAKSKLPYAEHVEVVAPGSKEHELLLQAGYQMSLDQAKDLIRQRKENPAAVPWEQFQAASAMVEALAAKPQVTSTRPAWQRSQPTRS